MREYRSVNRKMQKTRSDHYVYPDSDLAIVRNIIVFEPDGDWHDSGLLDASGNPLISRERIGRIGFIRSEKD